MAESKADQFGEEALSRGRELDCLHNELQNAVSERAAMQRQLNDASESLNRLCEERDASKGNLEHTNALLSQQKTIIADVLQREVELGRSLRETAELLSTRSLEVQAKESALVIANAQMAHLRDELGRQQDLVMELHDRIAKAEAIEEEHLKNCPKQVAELKTLLGEAESRLLSASDSHARTIETLNERIARARADAEKSREAAEIAQRDFANERTEMRSDIARYETDLQAAHKQICDLQVEKEQAKPLAQLEKSNLALRVEIDRLQRALTRERKLHSLQLADLQSQLQEKGQSATSTTTLALMEEKQPSISIKAQDLPPMPKRSRPESENADPNECIQQ